MSSNPFPNSQPDTEDYQPSAVKNNPLQSLLQKVPNQYKPYLPVAAIVVGLLFLFFIGSIFGSGGASKTIVYKEYETRDYLRKKAERGNAEAMFKYAGLCKDSGDCLKWMKKSAEKGYARAQYYLGYAYTEGGKGIEVDSDKSKKWLTKASKKGYPLAKFYCYYKGIGVEPDKSKAWKELEKGAKAGYGDAQYMLGMLYQSDNSGFPEVDKSEEKGEYWITKAAESGDSLAQMTLAINSIDKSNFEEGAKWFKKAAEQGKEEAQYFLGLAYLNGKGVPENKAEGKKWIKKAAEQGHYKAKEILKTID